jgi:hypothetical protein
MEIIVCPFCQTKIKTEPYSFGDCPNCLAHYYWDDDWNYELEEEGNPGFIWDKVNPIEFSIHQGMKSVISEQSSKKYKKISQSNKDWYIAIQPNEGDNIYVVYKDKKNQEGFCGSFISFELEDGTIDKVCGPWHSNSGSLLSATQYDVTHKHLTQGIIALDSTPVKGTLSTYSHKEVLHYDKEPKIGDFSRIEIMAQDFANKLNKEVYYAFVSNGGGCSGWKKPILF